MRRCRKRKHAHPLRAKRGGRAIRAGQANGDRTRRTAEHDHACNRPSLAKDESVPRRQIIRELIDMRDYLERASRSFGMKPAAARNNPVRSPVPIPAALGSVAMPAALRWPVFRLTEGCAGSCRWSPGRPGGRAPAGRSSTTPSFNFRPVRPDQAKPDAPGQCSAM
jgi:hypothetical protein